MLTHSLNLVAPEFRLNKIFVYQMLPWRSRSIWASCWVKAAHSKCSPVQSHSNWNGVRVWTRPSDQQNFTTKVFVWSTTVGDQNLKVKIKGWNNPHKPNYNRSSEQLIFERVPSQFLTPICDAFQLNVIRHIHTPRGVESNTTLLTFLCLWTN